MIRFSILLTRIAAMALLGSVVLLAGCSLGGTKEGVSTDSMRTQFDATIKAYKDGQFLVDGAVLSALDTGSHFAYLKDQGKLFAGAPPYPFHAQVREATAPIFYEILTGAVEPDAGLDQMAAAAEQELTNLGYRK